MPHVAAALLDALRRYPAAGRYVVAYSGGCDSHVLLHALVQLRASEAGRVTLAYPNAPIVAVHVNHGLQAQSDQWQQHCEQVCRQLKVDFIARRLQLSIVSGDSVEAVARHARYAAIDEVLQPRDMLLLAHHQDDQAETFLLQALRGSGVKGLACMPECIESNATWRARPLLSLTRTQIEQYARDNVLDWIDDPSNQSPKFDRNILRHQIMPTLKHHWPSMSATLARVTTHQAEANQLLTELAQLDFARCCQQDIYVLDVNGMATLSAARQANLLRYWIAEQCRMPLPDTRTCQNILDQVIGARQDAEPELKWSDVVLRRYRDTLYLEHQQHNYAHWQHAWDLDNPLSLPDGQRLIAQSVQGRGVNPEAITMPLNVRYRRGGEKCRLPGREHRHDLKKLFQQWGVPPWQRDRIPLIYHDDHLVQVVGFSVCEPFVADPVQAGIEIQIQAT